MVVKLKEKNNWWIKSKNLNNKLLKNKYMQNFGCLIMRLKSKESNKKQDLKKLRYKKEWIYLPGKMKAKINIKILKKIRN